MGSEETGWKPVFLRWQVKKQAGSLFAGTTAERDRQARTPVLLRWQAKKQAGSLFAGTGWKPVFPIMMTLSVVGCSRGNRSCSGKIDRIHVEGGDHILGKTCFLQNGLHVFR